MAERLVLHIGAMKTGTTYLQSMLHANRQALAAAGHLDARELGRPSGAVSKVLARPGAAHAVAPWRALAAAVRDIAARSVIASSEFLSFARPHQLAALMEPLAGIEVTAVLVVRDQVGAIPSQWQTFCRNYGDDTWPAYLRRIDPARAGDPASRAWRTYYRAQEIDRIVETWTGHPGVDRLEIVTLPRRRTDTPTLWQTFAGAAGLDAVPVVEPAERVNPSVGQPSAQMLQDLGHHWKRVGRPIHLVRPAMRGFIAEALVPRRQVEATPRLDRAGWAFTQARDEAATAAIAAATAAGRARVHGDLANLAAAARPVDLPETAFDVQPHEVRAAGRALWTSVRTAAGLPARRPPLRYQRLLREITEAAPATAAWEAVDRRLEGPLLD